MWKFKVVMVIICSSFVLGDYSRDRLLPECDSHSNFTRNCVRNDKSINATTGDTVNRLTEIWITREQAWELLLGNGQNIELRDHDDLPFAHGESIVKKEYAKQFHGRWIIKVNVSFNFDNTDYGWLIINVTVLNFQPRDEIPLKVVITLGSETVTTTTKKWFVHEQQTTQVPSSTPNVITKNTNDKEEENEWEEDTGKGEGKSKDSNIEKWLIAIFSLVMLIVIERMILLFQSCRSGDKRCCCHTRYINSPVSQDDVMLKDVKTIETSCTEPESPNLTVEESV